MKFIGLVGSAGLFDDKLQFVKCKSIDFRHRIEINRILFRVKIKKISQHEATCIADAPVSIGQLF